MTRECPKCRVELVPGRALSQTWTEGAPDFPGDNVCVTVSAGGPGRVIDCLKCPCCGHSLGFLGTK